MPTPSLKPMLASASVVLASIAPPVSGMKNSQAFTLQEREYIQSDALCRHLYVGVDASWAPVEFVDGDGEHQGLSSLYVEHIRNYTCLKITPAEVPDSSDYAALLHRSTNPESKADAKRPHFLSALIRTETREPQFYFSQSYLTLPVVVAVHRDKEEPDVFSAGPRPSEAADTAARPVRCKDGKPKRVAVVKGYAVTEFVERGGDIDPSCFYYTTSPEQALKAVAQGKADGYYDAAPILEHYRRNLPIRILDSPTPYWLEVRMAVPRLDDAD